MEMIMPNKQKSDNFYEQCIYEVTIFDVFLKHFYKKVKQVSTNEVYK